MPRHRSRHIVQASQTNIDNNSQQTHWQFSKKGLRILHSVVQRSAAKQCFIGKMSSALPFFIQFQFIFVRAKIQFRCYRVIENQISAPDKGLGVNSVWPCPRRTWNPALWIWHNGLHHTKTYTYMHMRVTNKRLLVIDVTEMYSLAAFQFLLNALDVRNYWRNKNGNFCKTKTIWTGNRITLKWPANK